jgi:hypothetical protein
MDDQIQLQTYSEDSNQAPAIKDGPYEAELEKALHGA